MNINNISLILASIVIILLISFLSIKNTEIRALNGVIYQQNAAIDSAKQIAKMEKDKTERQFDLIRQQYKRAQEKPKPPKEFFESCDQAIVWLTEQGKAIRDGQ